MWKAGLGTGLSLRLNGRMFTWSIRSWRRCLQSSAKPCKARERWPGNIHHPLKAQNCPLRCRPIRSRAPAPNGQRTLLPDRRGACSEVAEHLLRNRNRPCLQNTDLLHTCYTKTICRKPILAQYRWSEKYRRLQVIVLGSLSKIRHPYLKA